MTFNKTLLTLLFVSALPVTAIAGMESTGQLPSTSGTIQAHDATTGERVPADAADREDKRLLRAVLQLAAANQMCDLAFSDLNRYKPLGAQKRDDLQGCLWARYATEQAVQGSKPLSRAEWLEKTQLDARAADSQLVAAWQYPRTVRGPQ
ncbi:hypothetical protein ACQUXI_003942 [Cronobacter turicensis]|nr:hypothetical protein [Klebsiella pneumoniae]